MKVYVYQEKKKIAVALVQMYEYSVEYAAEYVGADARQVRQWLYEYYAALPEAPLFSQKRVQRNMQLYPVAEEDKRGNPYGNVVELEVH